MKSFEGALEFCSNMYVDEQGFCVEVQYQADKTTNPEDRQAILDCARHGLKQGYKAKSKVKHMEHRPDWKQIREQRIAHWIDVKFSYAPTAKLLIDTKDIVLSEKNDWHDNIWGDCVCCSIPNPRFGVKQTCRTPGRDILGKLLTKKRDDLLKHASATRALL